MKDLRRRAAAAVLVLCASAAAAGGLPAVCTAQEQYAPAAEEIPYEAEQYVPATEQLQPLYEGLEPAPVYRELYEVNRELVGWLHINETIDYPVVQRRDDNDYYLHHDFYGNEDGSGTLFVDGYNRIWPRDRALFIFGHNMRSGAAFGTLASYDQEAYMRAHPLISFRTVTDEEEVYYIPVSGFHASMVSTDPEFFFVMEPFLFEEEETKRLETEMVAQDPPALWQAPASDGALSDGIQAADTPGQENDGTAQALDEEEQERIVSERIWARYENYLNELLEHSLWQAPTSATIMDDLILLITCSYYQEDGRFILVCRRLRDYETPDGIAQVYSGAVQYEALYGGS